MSIPQPPKFAKLVVGFFLRDKDLVSPIALRLAEKFGEIDIVGPMMPFDYTSYYEPEMGVGLFRRILAFKPLIEQESLASIKIATNAIEAEFMEDGRRRVNIDPGYLVHERFVLASGKNFTHRIYIGCNIYADLTLIYTKGTFQTLPWTYPDYADKSIKDLLESIRKKYIIDLKQERK